MSLIYKICDGQLWSDAVTAGMFKGAAIDLEDGYIHFSTASQVEETASRHFRHQENLVLVTIATKELNITWEPSRGGDLFPHLYADLPVSAAVRVVPLACDDNGVPKPRGGWDSI